MLILHTADLHVGDSRNLPGYLDRQRAMLYGLTVAATSYGVRLMLICGDIFDSKYLRPRERDLLLEWLLHNDGAAERQGFDVIIQNGNHDELEDGYTHLRGYSLMAGDGRLRRTHVVESNPKMLGPFDGTYVAVVPSGNYKNGGLNDVVSALRTTLDMKLEAKGLSRDYKVVAMVHEAIVGAVNELGNYRVPRGPRVDPGLVDYWALGDIHKPYQQIAANAWYPGSPIQHDFGDLSPDRGCLVVDLDRPGDPIKHAIEGVVPLLTLEKIPAEWPDAIVRYRGPALEIAETRFPDSVVSFDPVVEDSRVTIAPQADLLARLPEVLREHPAELHTEITDEIESALQLTVV